MEVKRYEAIKEAMESAVSARSGGKLSDFNDGSAVESILSAVARQLEELYIAARDGYAANLTAMGASVFGIVRKEGVSATCPVSFSVQKPAATDVKIGAGARLTDGSHVFTTDGDATIRKGATASNTVTATSTGAGAGNNVDAGKLKLDAAGYDGVSASNEAATGGADAESDEDLAARLKEWMNGLAKSNACGLRAAALSVEGVSRAKVVEHFNEDEIRRNGGRTATVYIYPSDPRKLAAARLEVVGDGTGAHPGARAAGVNVGVEAAAVSVVDITARCSIDATEDKESAEAKMRGAIKSAVEELEIGETLYHSTLTHALRELPFVIDELSLAINGTGGNFPTGANAIARAGTITVEAAGV